MIIALDFDGTVVTHEYPRIGKDIGALPVLRKLVDSGVQIILYTMRSGKELDEAVAWFKERDSPLFGVNENPYQSAWTSSPKPYAHLYIDDAGLGIPLVNNWLAGRPYVDWLAVDRMLFGKDNKEEKH